MSISSTSFWQQDQAWQSQQQSLGQQLSATASLTSALTSALANQTTGLAGIANQQALDRVNAQISAAQKASSGSSASTSSVKPSSSASAGKSTPNTLSNSAVNLASTGTAAMLLSGQIPSGSLLSILA
jgi:hypothetical protein